MKWKSAAMGAAIIAALEIAQWVIAGWFGVKTLGKGSR
jgi:hypothetical protein